MVGSTVELWVSWKDEKQVVYSVVRMETYSVAETAAKLAELQVEEKAFEPVEQMVEKMEHELADEMAEL